jgi:hypothetical protein
MVRKKSEGIEALVPKPEPVSIQEITMLDWYAAFALMGIGSEAQTRQQYYGILTVAEAMMQEREKRL